VIYLSLEHARASVFAAIGRVRGTRPISKSLVRTGK
jgi:hypothetical protein